MSQYKGQDVKSRPIKETDQGYDKSKDQVVITFSDGREQTVEKSEVK